MSVPDETVPTEAQQESPTPEIVDLRKIYDLQLMSGHSFLARAMPETVKRWRDGDPTLKRVNFTDVVSVEVIRQQGPDGQIVANIGAHAITNEPNRFIKVPSLKIHADGILWIEETDPEHAIIKKFETVLHPEQAQQAAPASKIIRPGANGGGLLVAKQVPPRG